MGRWGDVAAADPVFAEKVREVFDAHRHKTLATLRRDGSGRNAMTAARHEAQEQMTIGLGEQERERTAVAARPEGL